MSETTQFDDPPSLTQENFKQWVKSKGYKNEEETENSWNVLVEKKIVDNGIVLKSFLENLSTSDFTSYGINPVISGFLFGWSHKAPPQQLNSQQEKNLIVTLAKEAYVRFLVEVISEVYEKVPELHEIEGNSWQEQSKNKRIKEWLSESSNYS